ncbi:MAG: LysR family transcriptional regulator [Betaproteobacteria bacterium]|nr:LysR family transcriptional regulator [Betaproteobacteria bacterium]
MEYLASAVPTDPLSLSRLLNRLRFKHLELLATLGETQVLHQAAKRINVSQPAATKMLADIEYTFGFSLFERHARGLRPTPLGAQVVSFALSLQRLTDNFVEDLNNKHHGGHGHLVIGAIMGSAPDVLARAVTELKKKRPLLHLKILGETSDQISLMLSRGEVEIAVGRITTQDNVNQFNFTPLSNETMVLAVRKAHPLTRQKNLSLDQLVQWPWIMQPSTSPARQLLESELAKAHVNSPENFIECSSVFAILQLIQTTDSIAAVSESVVRDHVHAKLIKVLPLPIGEVLQSFGIMSRRGEALSEAAIDFSQCLEKAALFV